MLGWHWRTDFFPPLPEDLDRLGSICIGTKSRNLGDALVLTTLPGKLKKRHPRLKINTFRRGFNAVAFGGNPHVDGITRHPRALYGDDINEGSGQLIQLKERFFGLPVSEAPEPEIHLSERECAWARNLIARRLLPGNGDRPLCLIHPWGTTRAHVADVGFWDRMVARWSGVCRFWQVGITGHSAVQGCEYYFLLDRGVGQARKLFSVMSEAALFVGVDSGPMHVARAFRVPSIILLGHAPDGGIARIFEDRGRAPYFLRGNWRFSPLYAENHHVFIGPGCPDPGQKTDDFFEQMAARLPRGKRI